MEVDIKTKKNQEAVNFLFQVKSILLNSNSWLESTKTPIKESFDMAISALQAQPNLQSTDNELVTDTISRKAAINAAENIDCSDGVGISTLKCEAVDDVVTAIKALPSAQPERKTGRWLIREGISDAQCSECKMYFRDVYDMDNSDAFCRHCGAKMEGLKVVEDE